jgi:hypothetical protein
MKVAEIEAPGFKGNISIKYKTEMRVTAKDVYDDVPPEVLQTLSKYTKDEVEQILLKLILASRIKTDKVLKPGEELLVGGEVIITP